MHSTRALVLSIVATALAAVAIPGSGLARFAASSVRPALPVLRTITRADDGTQQQFVVGERFLLALGSELNWTVTVADPSIVRRVPGILVVRGAQGVYEAERAGETDLQAVGTAICAPQAPCPQFALLFRVHLVVRDAGLKYRVVVPELAAGEVERNRFAVNGMVAAGPTCPVERIPPDPSCADRPVEGAEIIVLSSSGDVVADVLSDASGRFSVVLQPGAYTLEPQPVTGLPGTAPQQTVVVADADIDVTVSYDTGIR